MTAGLWRGVPVASPVTVVVLTVAFVVLTVLWRLRARRPVETRARRRRRVAPVALLTTTLVVGTASGAAAVNTYFGYLPQLGDVVGVAAGDAPGPALALTDRAGGSAVAARHPAGGVVAFTVPGDRSGFGPAPALAYLPPQYLAEPTRRFPVLYLLHGSPGVPADWFRGGRAASAALAEARAGRPVVVVVPAVSRGWLDDPECVDGIREPAESHLVRDVVPTVDTLFRTLPDRGHRALAGMSAGGYCALNVGLKHRDVFSAIVDMSGLDRPTHRGGVAALYGPGPQALTRAAADSPGRYAASLPPGPATAVWLDDGRSDRETLAGMRALAAALGAGAGSGVTASLHLRPGSHTFHVWRPALQESLDWLAARWYAGPRG